MGLSGPEEVHFARPIDLQGAVNAYVASNMVLADQAMVHGGASVLEWGRIAW